MAEMSQRASVAGDVEARRVEAVRRLEAVRTQRVEAAADGPDALEEMRLEELEIEARRELERIALEGDRPPSDAERAAVIEAAKRAARGSERPRGPNFYQDVAEHWLALETTLALTAAVAALEDAGFHVARPDRLRAAALEAGRADLWRRHVIIDGLDSDVHNAALVGIDAALNDYPPITYAEHQAQLDEARSR